MARHDIGTFSRIAVHDLYANGILSIYSPLHRKVLNDHLDNLDSHAQMIETLKRDASWNIEIHPSQKIRLQHLQGQQKPESKSSSVSGVLKQGGTPPLMSLKGSMGASEIGGLMAGNAAEVTGEGGWNICTSSTRSGAGSSSKLFKRK